MVLPFLNVELQKHPREGNGTSALTTRLYNHRRPRLGRRQLAIPLLGYTARLLGSHLHTSLHHYAELRRRHGFVVDQASMPHFEGLYRQLKPAA